MKNYIFFALAAVTFGVSILFLASFDGDNKILIIMFSFGALFASFLRLSCSNEQHRERIYKNVIREKKEEIKYLQVMNVHLAQSANDFFNALNSKNKEVPNTLLR
jgi:hypothetical protein